MKILLAGAFGNLGIEILRVLSEGGHEKTYGLDPEYQKYSDTVPLLFPFSGQYHSMKVYRD